MKTSVQLFLAIAATLAVAACGASRKIDRIRTSEMSATLALSRDERDEERSIISSKRDSIMVHDDDLGELYVMHAVQENGEMVVADVLDAAVISARFRNVAERNGKIDLRFEIIVPKDMQDSKWQLRFYPDLFVMEDSLRLESVIITGADYRKSQMRGYQQYERFLSTIISDTTRFIDLRNLEIFIQRNIPQVYKFKTDSSFVSDEEFRSYYGVTEQEAIDHYTNGFAIHMNQRRIAMREKMYAKYVKVPISIEGVRLDTVIRNLDGDFVYQYTQVISTRPKLRKVDVVLSGDIYESDKKLYSMEPTPPLTFYISSLSAFTNTDERYLTRVVERRAAANMTCNVDFRLGKFNVDPSLGSNEKELGRIRQGIVDLLQNEVFDLDSIVISASASPEGSVRNNYTLSQKRAAAVAGYFDTEMADYCDTLPQLHFLSRSNGENWDMLSLLVDTDSIMSVKFKQSYMDFLEISNLDERERRMQKAPFYPYMKDNLYPRLRTVRFDFHMHRRGMLKDTLHTTELDTVYMRGVKALQERNYEEALSCLRDYRDFNTAIAFVSLDYNASAMAILQELERTPQVNYMMAILYARKGDDRKAVQCYLDACREEQSFVFRGNLDPEIYILIQRYGLNSQ